MPRPRRWGMDDSEFLKLLTHIHDEMLEVVKEQHPSHEQFAAWLLRQIEGRLRMRIRTVKTPCRAPHGHHDTTDRRRRRGLDAEADQQRDTPHRLRSRRARARPAVRG